MVRWLFTVGVCEIGESDSYLLDLHGYDYWFRYLFAIMLLKILFFFFTKHAVKGIVLSFYTSPSQEKMNLLDLPLDLFSKLMLHAAASRGVTRRLRLTLVLSISYFICPSGLSHGD